MKEIQKKGEMFWKNISHKKKKWFTLVELIIVITILAILATIAFVSFQNYTKDARDGNRTATLTQLEKGLELYSIKTGNYPTPENLYASWYINTDTLLEVWYIKDSISRSINFFKTPTDPVSGDNYVYWVSHDKTYYQIATTLENLQAKVVGNYKWIIRKWDIFSNPASLVLAETGWKDITQNRYFVTDKWQNLPYKLTATTTLTWWTAKSSTGITITKSNWNTLSWSIQTNLWVLPEIVWVMVYGESEYFSTIKNGGGNGWETPSANPYATCTWPNNPTPFAATTTYLWCGQADIIICSWPWAWYTIASCNVWSTTAGTWSSSYGKYFQWWENVAWDATSNVTSSNNCTWNRDTQACWASAYTAWQITVWDTTSGWNDRWTDYGDTRWPCAPWYKVPSNGDWVSIHTAGSWWTSWTNMQNALKLPYAGRRLFTNGALSSPGTNGFYWSTTPDTSRARNLHFYSSSVNPSHSSNRVNGFSVRCIKN